MWMVIVLLVALLLVAIAILGGLLIVLKRRLRDLDRRQQRAAQALVDLTDRLRKGVFEIRQHADGTFQHVFANRMAREYGRLEPDVSGAPVTSMLEFVHTDDRQELSQALAASARSGCPFNRACRYRFPGGQWGWIVIEASAREQADGGRLWNGFVIDLTAERALNDSLRKALHQKRDFVATVGRELRLPVSALATGAQVLQQRQRDPDRYAALGQVTELVSHLDKYIAGLLRLSQLDAGEPRVRLQAVPLRAALARQMTALDKRCRQRGLRFEYHEAGDLPEHVLLDTGRLQRVLTYLVDSAIIVARTGTLRLQVQQAEPVDDADAASRMQAGDADRTGAGPRCWLVFRIQHEGILIDAEPAAVTPLVASARALRELGLAVAGRLVARWGGRLDAGLVEQQGSSSEVVLPCPVAAEGDALPAADPPPWLDPLSAAEALAEVAPRTGMRTSWRAARVLYVDADKLNRMMLASLLREEGFEVREAATVAEGLQEWRGGDFDVMLLDPLIPGAAELQTSARQRGADAGQSAPVLIGIVDGLSGQALHAARLDFDRVLIKPLDLASLTEMLEAAVAAPTSND